MQVRACQKAEFAQHEQPRLEGHTHRRGMDGASSDRLGCEGYRNPTIGSDAAGGLGSHF